MFFSLYVFVLMRSFFYRAGEDGADVRRCGGFLYDFYVLFPAIFMIFPLQNKGENHTAGVSCERRCSVIFFLMFSYFFSGMCSVHDGMFVGCESCVCVVCVVCTTACVVSVTACSWVEICLYD